MRIAAVNTFLAPNFSALKNNKSSNNTQNTNNDYQLPNYKLSFGMSKAAINRRRSGLNYGRLERTEMNKNGQTGNGKNSLQKFFVILKINQAKQFRKFLPIMRLF